MRKKYAYYCIQLGDCRQKKKGGGADWIEYGTVSFISI